jgi:peroxiredoxin-like protein
MEDPRSSKLVAYRTSVRWEHNRSGELSSPLRSRRAPLEIDLGGPGEHWTPGELLVGAVESCTMATVLALARRSGLPLAAVASNAIGTLEADKIGYAFTTITLSLHVTVYSEEDRERVAALIRQAHESCFVCRSLNTVVNIDYTIDVAAVHDAE